MDPTENLRLQLSRAQEIVNRIDASEDSDSDIAQLRAVARLADDLAGLVHNLDRWLCNGGHLPAQWVTK